MRCTVRDLDVHYESAGSGRPVLLLHGWGPDHRLMTGCFEPVFHEFDGEFRRLYPDLPGMGRTPGAPWIDGSDRMLDVVLDLVDALIGDEPFVLVGESYGGYLARGVVARRAEQVAGLALLCPVAVPDTPRVPVHTVVERDPAFLATLDDDARRDFTGINVRQTRVVWERFAAEVRPGLQMADHRFLEHSLSRRVPFAVDPKLERPFERPTLLLAGRQDSVVGYQDLWDTVEDYPRASFVLLDGAGHNLQFEQPELFAVAVREWLDRVRHESVGGV